MFIFLFPSEFESFERYRFVSISKLYYRITFMIIDIPTLDALVLFALFEKVRLH